MTSAAGFPGTVYGLVLNHKGALMALGEAVTAAPYKAPPRAPVLYIKPPNTYLASGGLVAVPTEAPALRVQPTLGLVIGRTATRVSADGAWDHLAGMVLAAEVCIPHQSLFRPAIRQRCRDGFLPLGSPRAPLRDAVEVSLTIDGVTRAKLSTTDLLRPIPRLLAEVTDFMTLFPGDVLLVGLPPEEPLARPGEAVAVEAAGFPTLNFALAAELDLDEGEAA